jgi:hypothetical protein
MIYRSRVGAEWGGDDHSVKAPPPPMANHALHAVDALLHGMAMRFSDRATWPARPRRRREMT